jgi:kynurenine formamidase
MKCLRALVVVLILVVPVMAQKSLVLPPDRIVDLTYAFDANSVYWPTAEQFKLETDFEGMTDKGYFYSAYRYSAAEHGGTHLDSPVHFAKGRYTVDQLPLEHLMGPAIVIDVTEKCATNPDYLVSVADFENWEKRNGKIPAGTIVLLRTGFGKFYPDRKKYLGTEERGAEAVAKLHFPGLDPVAARWITTNRSIKAIGLDTASIDYGQSTLFESHRALFEKNVPAFENVANLDQLPAKGFSVIALPMKIKGGSGGPLRIIALL